MNVVHVIDGELIHRLPQQWQRRLAVALANRLVSGNASRNVGMKETPPAATKGASQRLPSAKRVRREE